MRGVFIIQEEINMSGETFELMVITPELDFPQETSWVNDLFAEGLGTLHLRKPGQSSQSILQYLLQIEPQYHGRIMVHYQEMLMDEIAVKGVHYHFSCLPQEKPKYSVSCGCHSWDEFQEIEKRVDYAFISPFFNSISKEGYLAEKKLRHITPEINIKKAVALGGIKPANIHSIKKLKLKGAAVLGAIWGYEDPLDAFRELNSVVEALG